MTIKYFDYIFSSLIKIPKNYIKIFSFFLFITFLSYLKTLTNEFSWDDVELIINNLEIRDLSNIVSFFYRPFSDNIIHNMGSTFYRPFANLTYAIDYKIWGGANSFGFHFVNIMLHFMTSIFIFLYFEKILENRKVAAFITAIFIVHPVNTEVINLITYRTNILSALFIFIALYFYSSINNNIRYFLVPFLFLLSIFSKEQGTCLPFLIFVHDLIFYKDFKIKRLAITYLPFLLMFIFYYFIRSEIILPSHYKFFEGLSPFQLFLFFFRILFLYIKLLIIPYPLNPFYDWHVLGVPVSLFEPDIIAGFILFCLIIFAMLYSYKKDKILCFGLLFFFTGLLPVSHIMSFFVPAAERFLYISLAGGILFLVRLIQIIESYYRMKRLTIYVCTGILLLFFGITFIRNFDWQNRETILVAQVRDFENSFSGHLGLGRFYVEKNRDEEALKHFDHVIGLMPSSPIGYGMKAAALAKLYRLDNAKDILLLAPKPKSEDEQTAFQIAKSFLLEIKRPDIVEKLNLK